MTRKLSAKKLAEQLERAAGDGILINVLDISKVFKAGRLAAESGADIRKAVRDATDAVRCDAGPRIAAAA